MANKSLIPIQDGKPEAELCGRASCIYFISATLYVNWFPLKPKGLLAPTCSEMDLRGQQTKHKLTMRQRRRGHNPHFFVLEVDGAYQVQALIRFPGHVSIEVPSRGPIKSSPGLRSVPTCLAVPGRVWSCLVHWSVLLSTGVTLVMLVTSECCEVRLSGWLQCFPVQPNRMNVLE